MFDVKIYTQLEIVKSAYGLFFKCSNGVCDLKSNEKPSNMISDEKFGNLITEIDNFLYNLNEYYLEEDLRESTIKTIRYTFIYNNSTTIREVALRGETFDKLMNLDSEHEYMDELTELLSEFGFNPKDENYFKCILLDPQEN